MPWKKTAAGWERLMTVKDDETVYYEDKFAMIFPTPRDLQGNPARDWQFERFGCTTYCHASSERPCGYKGSEYVVDVWHWKAARTDPVGQVDDKYWKGFDLLLKDVGRHGDPPPEDLPKGESGGYLPNVSGDGTRPKMLPRDPSVSDNEYLLADQAAPYDSEVAKTIPAGTEVAGIIVEAFQGDRGDVRCRSEYADGRWRLWIRRDLDTGSDFDAQFVPGRSYPFGCAAFDHSSNRHAYGMAVYWLVLEQQGNHSPRSGRGIAK